MKRIKDNFLSKVESFIPLADKRVLEVGCGEGSRSAAIAQCCQHLTAIDPSEEAIKTAIMNSDKDIKFEVAFAEKLPYADNTFDIVLYTLSLHHVPVQNMAQAIEEGVRVTKKDGSIIFLEPTEKGSFFEAELNFDACDGDERVGKKAAHEAIINAAVLKVVKEIRDETIFSFTSVDDFVEAMKPKNRAKELSAFLEKYKYLLVAERRISICQPIKI